MKQPHLYCAIAGLCFCTCYKMRSQTASCPCDSTGRQKNGYNCPAADSGATARLAVKAPPWGHFWQTVHVTGGQLTIPFKIRPQKQNGTFRLTTDVTLGFYIGATKRLNEKKEYFLTVPLTAGLTFININSDNTTLDMTASSDDGADVVPGLTWSTGLILQLDQYNIGLIFGKDYASDVGNQWMYHRKWWWSFGLGFSFLK